MSDHEGFVELKFSGTAAQIRRQVDALFGTTALAFPGAAADLGPSVHEIKDAIVGTPTTDPAPPPAEEPKKRGPKPKAKVEPEPAIRTNPEDRKPADEQDDPETQAQDDADEQGAAPEDPGPSSNADVADGLFEDSTPAVEEPEYTAVDVRNEVGAWLTRRGGKLGDKSPENLSLQSQLVPLKNALYEKHLGAGKIKMEDVEAATPAQRRALVAALKAAK